MRVSYGNAYYGGMDYGAVPYGNAAPIPAAVGGFGMTPYGGFPGADLPWGKILVVGGLLLALSYFGTKAEYKRRRRRR